MISTQEMAVLDHLIQRALPGSVGFIVIIVDVNAVPADIKIGSNLDSKSALELLKVAQAAAASGRGRN